MQYRELRLHEIAQQLARQACGIYSVELVLQVEGGNGLQEKFPILLRACTSAMLDNWLATRGPH